MDQKAVDQLKAQIAQLQGEIERLRGKQSKMTSEQVLIIALVMCDINAKACNVNAIDNWLVLGEDFLTDARLIVDELNRAALEETK